jgi:hypothetical protein
MAKTFQVPATLTRISSRVDGGLSLGFTTAHEVTPEEKLTAFTFQNTYGWILFRENEFRDEDVPKADAERSDKSMSQRLRAVLFRQWEQRAEPKAEFEIFYRYEMEKRIKDIKDKLD